MGHISQNLGLNLVGGHSQGRTWSLQSLAHLWEDLHGILVPLAAELGSHVSLSIFSQFSVMHFERKKNLIKQDGDQYYTAAAVREQSILGVRSKSICSYLTLLCYFLETAWKTKIQFIWNWIHVKNHMNSFFNELKSNYFILLNEEILSQTIFCWKLTEEYYTNNNNNNKNKTTHISVNVHVLQNL